MNESIRNVIEKICEKETEGRKKNEQPLCVLLGGLPGSGKTNLVEKVKEKYKERDFVVIDTDDYRKLHPNYETLLKTPERAIDETSSFSNSIEAELIRRAIEQRCDIISVTTLRATEAIDDILYVPAVDAGYEMEACIMAVPVSESGLSAQRRYEQQIACGECPRFTPMNFIEGSHNGIRQTIQMLQNKADRPTISVYSRGESADTMPIEIYSSRVKDDRYSCALEAFMHPIAQLDPQTAAEQINELYRLKQSRNANEVEYSSLKRLEQLFGIVKGIER